MHGRHKAGLFFGISMTVFFIVYDLLVHTSEITSIELLKAVVSAIIGGAIAGLIFGFFIGSFSNAQLLKTAARIQLHPDEQIVFQSPANHMKGIEGVGGLLLLTNKRLIFQSHKFNIQNHQLFIDLGDIAGIDKYKPLGITNNGLIVHTNRSQHEKFVLDNREEWLNYLHPGIRHAT